LLNPDGMKGGWRGGKLLFIPRLTQINPWPGWDPLNFDVSKGSASKF